MAHNIETMAYAGATPWHKLGVPVTQDLTPHQIAVAAGIDWEVEKRPLYTISADGSPMLVEERFGLTRVTDGRVLDVVGPLYKPIQNLEALDFFDRFVKAGDMSMETAGALDKGRRIWGLASIKDSFTLAGGDRVDGYLLLSSPHLQGAAFTAKFTSVRVVCQNTLTAALNGGGATFRMSHAHAFDDTMKQAAMDTLGIARERLHELEEKAIALAAATIKSEQALLRFVADLSGSAVKPEVVEPISDDIDASELTAAFGPDLEAEINELRSEIKASDLNRLGTSIMDSINGAPGAELVSAKNTWWGAVNGVSHVVDHVIGRTDDARMTFSWFGGRGALKNRALDLALQNAKAGR